MEEKRTAVTANRSTPEHTILIVPKEDGSAGSLYYASLSGTEWGLKTETLSTVPSSSKLVTSSKHLNRLRSANIYIVVSTQSGAGLAVTAFDNILQPLLKQFDIPFSVHKTVSKTSHREFLKSLTFSPDKKNIIIIFGGDTVIYDVLNSVSSNRNLSSSLKIDIRPIPCGTGNALATSLGTTSIPIGITKALGISEISPQRLPVLKVVIREDVERVIWGANVCSWGLHASLVADSDDPEMRRQYGASRFLVAAERLLSPDPHIYHGKLWVDDTPVRGSEHTYLLISHVSHLEPTFPIAPKQSPLSATVSVIEIGPMSGEELMNIMRAVYDHSKHLQTAQVGFMGGVSRVRFEVNEEEERWRRICIDGDIITVADGASISVLMCDGIEAGEIIVSLYI